MDTEKNKELWDRLENEPERAYRAFECYRSLPSGERTLIGAYRQHVGNPEAAKPSDTWSRWFSQFGWRERAAAYDHHLELIRERAMEEAIKEEAQKMAREAEKTRYRYNELMTLGYERAISWLENAEPSDFRPQDVIQIIRLHMDDVKAFEATETPREEVTWTEEEKAEINEIIREIEAEGAAEELEEHSDEDPESGDPGESSEETG